MNRVALWIALLLIPAALFGQTASFHPTLPIDSAALFRGGSSFLDHHDPASSGSGQSSTRPSPWAQSLQAERETSAGSSTDNPCGFRGLARHAWTEAGQFSRGFASAPRNAIRPDNLKWELPVGAATGVLIAEGDRPLADRIRGKNIQDISRLWSNIGLGVEIGSSGLAYAVGCAGHRSYLRETGLTTLDALAAAGTTNLVLKLAFDRQFPYKRGTQGEFWEGGRSFPSGHAMVSWAFAAAVAHRYPHNRWLKWGAYGLATGVALSRYPAKRHYASDILVGSALGYITGSYMAEH